MGVIFERLKNRTMRDYYNQIIQPRQVLLLTDAVQKTGVEAKREHTYRNRTGALETSVRWQGAKVAKDFVQAEISAGGPSVTRYAFDFTARQEGTRRRNRRNHRDVRRGGPIYVNYAGFVEGHKYRVLTFFVKRNIPLFRKALGSSASVERA